MTPLTVCGAGVGSAAVGGFAGVTNNDAGMDGVDGDAGTLERGDGARNPVVAGVNAGVDVVVDVSVGVGDGDAVDLTVGVSFQSGSNFAMDDLTNKP